MLQSRSGQPRLEHRGAEMQVTTQGCASSHYWQRCRTAGDTHLDVQF